MAQQMQAEMTKLIFWRQNAYVHIGKTHRLRAIVKSIPWTVVERRYALVQVDCAGASSVGGEGGKGDRILLWSNVQVDVSIWSQPASWIEPGYGPAFRQDWLDPSAVQQFQALDQLMFAKGRLKNFVAISLAEAKCRLADRRV